MKIYTLKLGEVIKENCYILEKDGRVIMIDPGQGYNEIKNFLNKNNLKCEFILLTHGHFDHAYSCRDFQEQGVKVCIHEDDADKLYTKGNLSLIVGLPFPKFHADILLKEGDYNFAGFDIKVIHTPGHSKGSCCFIIEDNIFTGDTIIGEFQGRTDFYDGNEQEIEESIKKIKKYLNKDYKKHCGH